MPIKENWGEAGEEREREAVNFVGNKRSRCVSAAKVINNRAICKSSAETKKTGNVNEALKVKGILTDGDKQNLTQLLKSFAAVKKADLTLIKRGKEEIALHVAAAHYKTAYEASPKQHS